MRKGWAGAGEGGSSALMPSTSCSCPKNERRRSHEIRGDDLKQSATNHTGFRRSPSACVCLVDASGEVTAVVWLQGRHEVRDRNGFSCGWFVHSENAHRRSWRIFVYRQVRRDHRAGKDLLPRSFWPSHHASRCAVLLARE